MNNIVNTCAKKWQIKSFNELNTHELYEILKIRNEVFMTEQRIKYNDLDNIDFDCLHIYLCDDEGTVYAYARAIPRGRIGAHAAFGRVCVRQELRGNGIARELIKRVIGMINDRFDEKDIEISAQAYLEKLYASFGFKTVSDVFTVGGIEHIKMNNL